MKLGLAKQIQAGDFLLRPGWSVDKIAKSLTLGRADIKVTLIEGWRREEIAEEIQEEIPEEARLLAVIDSFDAMTTDRPYRSAIPPEIALEEIKQRAGVQFDPEMTEIFQLIWESSVVKSIIRDQVESGDEVDGKAGGVKYYPVKNG